MAVGTQLGLLLWKNFTYRRRQRVSGRLGWGYPEPLVPGTGAGRALDTDGYRDPHQPCVSPRSS